MSIVADLWLRLILWKIGKGESEDTKSNAH